MPGASSGRGLVLFKQRQRAGLIEVFLAHADVAQRNGRAQRCRELKHRLRTIDILTPERGRDRGDGLRRCHGVIGQGGFRPGTLPVQGRLRLRPAGRDAPRAEPRLPPSRAACRPFPLRSAGSV